MSAALDRRPNDVGARAIRLTLGPLARTAFLQLTGADYDQRLNLDEGKLAGKPTARVRLWPRRLVTKKSGARVMERDGEFDLDDDESFAFEVTSKGRPGTP